MLTVKLQINCNYKINTESQQHLIDIKPNNLKMYSMYSFQQVHTDMTKKS